MVKALVDGDNIAFRALTASNVQKNRWQYQHRDGSIELFHGLDKRQIVKQAQEQPEIYEGGELQQTVLITGSPQVAILNTRDMLQRVFEKLKTDNFVIYLGEVGVPDFRRKLANLIPYKVSRKLKPPPVFIREVHEYLVEHWNAVICKDIEADDAMATAQFTSDEHTVICTVDKDLDMIPGEHYNYTTEEYYTTSDPGEIYLVSKTNEKGKVTKKLKGGGLIWFYAQMLLGDTSDDIPNVAKGYGPVTKVFPLLNGVTDEHEMLKIVYDAYKKDANLPDIRAYLLELIDLLWIRRTPNESKSMAIAPLLEEIIRNDNEM